MGADTLAPPRTKPGLQTERGVRRTLADALPRSPAADRGVANRAVRTDAASAHCAAFPPEWAQTTEVSRSS